MALVLVKEDGSGRSDANSYASAADGDSYHEGHLYAGPWTGASSGQQEAALVMATRVIDAQYQFHGVRVQAEQALQWPRAACRDVDGEEDLPEDRVPRGVVQATCELARELLVSDRTGAPVGEGIYFVRAADGTQTIYSKNDRRPIISPVAQAMLGKFGSLLKTRSGAVKLIRT